MLKSLRGFNDSNFLVSFGWIPSMPRKEVFCSEWIHVRLPTDRFSVRKLYEAVERRLQHQSFVTRRHSVANRLPYSRSQLGANRKQFAIVRLFGFVDPGRALLIGWSVRPAFTCGFAMLLQNHFIAFFLQEASDLQRRLTSVEGRKRLGYIPDGNAALKEPPKVSIEDRRCFISLCNLDSDFGS
jgi:hypothetical protein